MFPVGMNVPVTGSNNWALAVGVPGAPLPPATSTFPFLSRVAVAEWRTAPRLPVAVNVPLAGSNNSATSGGVVGPTPPATSTFPLLSNVAVCKSRGVVRLPVRDIDKLGVPGAVVSFPQPMTLQSAAAMTEKVKAECLCIRLLLRETVTHPSSHATFRAGTDVGRAGRFGKPPASADPSARSPSRRNCFDENNVATVSQQRASLVQFRVSDLGTPLVDYTTIRTAGGRRESPLLLRGRRCGRLNQLEIELSFAFDKEQTVRSRIAARRVPVVAARLQEIRSGAKPEFRLALRSLDESPGHDHDLHVVRVGVEGRSESGRELEERPECALRVIAPQIRNLDSGGAARVEIRPFQVAGRHNDEPACRCGRGALAFRRSKQYRRRSERDQQRQEVSHPHRVPLVSGTRSSRLADGPEPIAPCRSSPLRPSPIAIVKTSLYYLRSSTSSADTPTRRTPCGFHAGSCCYP